LGTEGGTLAGASRLPGSVGRTRYLGWMAATPKEPNHALAQAIQRSGSSHKGLATRVRTVARRHGVELHCDHVQVRRWIDGVQPRAETARFIAEALGEKLGRTPLPRELGFTSSPDAAPLRFSPGECHEDVHGAVEALASLVGADMVDVPTGSAAIDPALWLSSAMGWLFQQRPPRDAARASLARIGPCDVEAIQVMSAHFMAMDFQFGGGYARTLLARYFHDDVIPLLGAQHPEHTRKDLFTAAASVAQLLGWTAYDLGCHGRAQHYMVQGLRLAQEADDRMMGARLLANMSHQATYLGRFREARQLAMAAREGANGHATPAVSAMLLAMHARAAAGAGDEREASAVLAQAENALSHVTDGDEPPWIAYFDRCELAGEAAHCFRDLRRPKEAAPFIEEALALMPPALTRTRAFIQLVDAGSSIQANDIDAACDLTLAALKGGAGLKSERYRHYVRDVLADLAPHTGAVGVDIVRREALRSFPSR
jgi:hypothetical protein